MEEKKMPEMEKTYNPQEIEQPLYEEWESSGAFVAHRDPKKVPFTIVMPPPNITGQLHMGHAMDSVLQDSLTRYHRMKGDAIVLWNGINGRELFFPFFRRAEPLQQFF